MDWFLYDNGLRHERLNGKKYERFLVKIAHISFSLETFLVYPTVTQRKRKTYDANDLLALSLVSIIALIYFLEKTFQENKCASNL